MIDITNGAYSPERTAVALGYFDGLHLGHAGVIGAALRQDGLRSAVFTFSCDTTLPKFSAPEDIISFENKCELFSRIGVEYLYAPDFAEVCGYSPEDFVSEILVRRLNAGFACCGRSFRFGSGGSGDPDMLRSIGKELGVEVEIVPDVCFQGVTISSTHIRELIRDGRIEQANSLLGYELWYRLPVIMGNQIGKRLLNYPTINQIIPPTNVIPKYGVYKSYTEVEGRHYRSVTNIGVKPTIQNRRDGSGVVMETHIIGFDGDLYGENIAVSLAGFIRPEIKFAGLEELKRQISADKEKAMK